MLFTVTVTDKTFGELLVNLDEFRGLPECKSIRWLQHRVMVQPSEASIMPEASKREKTKSAAKTAEKEAENNAKASQ